MTMQAVIFDCFGVLVTDGWTQFCESHFSASTQKLNEAKDLERSYNRGFISYEEFIAEIAALASLNKNEAHTSLDGHASNAKLLAFIRTSIAPHYKIGMLSNIGDDDILELFTEEERGLFSVIALSHKTGALKPRPEAYEGIAERLGLQPAECMFIDDNLDNCHGAEAVGMQAIHYQTTADLIQKLQVLS